MAHPPTAGRRSDEALEHCGEVRLGLKADIQRDFHQPMIRLGEQFFGPLDAPLQKKVMRTQTSGGAKLCVKILRAETGDLGQIGQTNRLVEALIDEALNELHTPLLE